MSAAGPGLDRDALDEALETINRARARGPGDAVRTADLLGGLEKLLAADRAGRTDRDPGGGDALAELDGILREAGAEDGAESLRTYIEPILERLIEALLDRPEERLAAYGSLRRGEENHHRISRLVGRWLAGTVEGTRYERGWGAAQGYPGLVWRPGDPPVAVEVFESRALPEHWERLDAFEGPGYDRILAPVDTAAGVRVCNLYAVRGTPDGAAATDVPRSPGA